jgi:CubicO group peptidase (beta-lactamase class C family)
MIERQFERRQVLAAGGALLALAANPAVAKQAITKNIAPKNPDWKKVQLLLDGFVANGRLCGAVGAMARGADDAYFAQSGTIARDESRAMDADSLFRVYSMTKPITGIAAMMLIEDGAIGLDQNIADFISGFKNPQVLIDPMNNLSARRAANPITIRNLLTHTAGLGYSVETEGPLLDAYNNLGLNPFIVSRNAIPGNAPVQTAPSLAEFADRVATLPLIAEPGSRWSYSMSLDVLGRVIEVGSGMAFDAFLMTRIFAPLSMTSSFFQVPASQAYRLTTNYAVPPMGDFPIDTGRDSIFLDCASFPFGGSGLVMSPRDYDRFLLMLAGYGALGSVRIMKPDTAKLAMSNLLPAGTKTKGTRIAGQGFGAGGRVVIARNAKEGLGRFGWTGAAATIAWVDPTRNVRACGFAQFMPNQAMPFMQQFDKAVYASL